MDECADVHALHSGAGPARSGANHASIAPYGPFTTGDGQTVLWAIRNSRRNWHASVGASPSGGVPTNDDRFRTNPMRVKHRAALAAEIDEVFQRLSAADVLGRLDSAGIANARLNRVAEFAAHRNLRLVRWTTVDSPSGPLDVLQPPVIVEGAPPALGPIPALGEHTASILAELGFDGSSIAAWKQKGLL